MRYLIAFYLLMMAGFAYSNPPTPTPFESAGKPESQARQSQNNTASDKRGTKEFPAIIEISKSPVIQVEATDKTEKRRDYTSSDGGWFISLELWPSLLLLWLFIRANCGVLLRP